ncbi:MAG: hypothetical protein J0L85_07910 [Zoogloea sp.]|nr:hypothetical protein [Zoogloea sp.]MCA0186038.1 hypothetical protein [Pseudomonadota bacterium]
MATAPTHLKLAILNSGKTMVIDEPVPNQPDAIAALGKILGALHAGTRQAIHFQLRDPTDGRMVLVLEHGATTFQEPRGFRYG